MASKAETFKVLIVGGGVAGLSLANMLERFGVDYLILEGHSQIAPGVGASIGMFPNGLRILDQIDCYEPLLGFVDFSKDILHTRDETGKSLVSIPRFQEHLEQRHGYPLMFFDRQWLLQSLYDRLQNKNRVLLNKKITQVDLSDGGIEVATADGQTFRGSLVIGADGVHSSVRREMHRLGNQLNPGYFVPDEQNNAPCYYLCNFGIAQHVPNWVAGEQCTVLGNGHSQLVVSGPEDRVYWFFFSKLPETKYGDDAPKCTKEMEAQFVEKYAQTPITPNVTFGQVYAQRLSSTLTPVHEFVCKKWFFKRMMIFGDSAHKSNPIGGQGGNGAIESAAAFVNALLRKKENHSGTLDRLSDKDIEDIFTEMQATRHVRAERIVSVSHLQQSLAAYETPLMSKLIWQFLVPLKGNEGSLSLFGLSLVRSAKLDKLPVKKRPRAVLYQDELPAAPLEKPRLFQLVFTALMVYLILLATDAVRCSSFGQSISPAGAPSYELNTMYSTSQLITPIMVATLEGYRLGNRANILAMPSIFMLPLGMKGIGKIGPIYTLVSAFLANNSPTGRFIRPEVVNAVFWALSLGYMLPMALMISPTSARENRQILTKVAWFSPFLVCILTYVFASAIQLWKPTRRIDKNKEESELDRYKGKDLSALKFLYSYAFITQATVHLATFAFVHYEANTSVFNVVWGLSRSFQLRQNSDNPGSPPNFLLGLDMTLAAMAWFIGNLYSIWDLRRLGYIKTRDAIAPVLGVILGQALVGPGATWVGQWYWRETVLSGLKLE